MSVSINGTNGLTFNDASSQNTAATGFGFKNRIINGAMVIDQRNAGASVTPTANAYTLDRWRYVVSQASKMSLQQNAGSVALPIGFTKYLGATSLSSYAVLTSDFFFQQQSIEGFNVADLGWGTASAQTITLSFRVYSSLTGTFGGSLQNGAFNRSYPFTYSIPVANTWTTISLTITGDTSGTWATDNTAGLKIHFGMGAGATYSGTAGAWASAEYYSATGAVSVVGTSGATFYITGVQLEKGSTATSFDCRPYGTELALCQRYCFNLTSTLAYYRFESMPNSAITTRSYIGVTLPIPMRQIPSLTWSCPFGDYISGATGTSAIIITDGNSNSHATIELTFATGTTTAYSASAIRVNNTTSWYARFESEL